MKRNHLNPIFYDILWKVCPELPKPNFKKRKEINTFERLNAEVIMKIGLLCISGLVRFVFGSIIYFKWQQSPPAQKIKVVKTHFEDFFYKFFRCQLQILLFYKNRCTSYEYEVVTDSLKFFLQYWFELCYTISRSNAF